MLDRAQLIKLVEQIISADGTEEEIDEMLRLFSSMVPHPSASDLIYWSNPQLDPESIVDVALSYKPRSF